MSERLPHDPELRSRLMLVRTILDTGPGHGMLRGENSRAVKQGDGAPTASLPGSPSETPRTGPLFLACVVLLALAWFLARMFRELATL